MPGVLAVDVKDAEPSMEVDGELVSVLVRRGQQSTGERASDPDFFSGEDRGILLDGLVEGEVEPAAYLKTIPIYMNPAPI